MKTVLRQSTMQSEEQVAAARFNTTVTDQSRWKKVKQENIPLNYQIRCNVHKPLKTTKNENNRNNKDKLVLLLLLLNQRLPTLENSLHPVLGYRQFCQSMACPSDFPMHPIHFPLQKWCQHCLCINCTTREGNNDQTWVHLNPNAHFLTIHSTAKAYLCNNKLTTLQLLIPGRNLFPICQQNRACTKRAWTTVTLLQPYPTNNGFLSTRIYRETPQNLKYI